jgi:hypothetical protein
LPASLPPLPAPPPVAPAPPPVALPAPPPVAPALGSEVSSLELHAAALSKTEIHVKRAKRMEHLRHRLYEIRRCASRSVVRRVAAA